MIQFGNKEAASIYIGGKEVQKIEIGGKTAYEKPSAGPDYFYIENTYAGSNTLTLTSTLSGVPSPSDYSQTVQYSKDRTNWTTITFDIQTPYTISMDQGEKVYFRNDYGKFNYNDRSGNGYFTSFTCSQSNNAGGNLNSLLDYTNIDNVTLPIGAFFNLLSQNSTLVDASDIVITHTVLNEFSHAEIFKYCTSLTGVPDMSHITTLAYASLNGCFNHCTSLVTPPDFNSLVTTGERSGLSWTFHDCSSLSRTPLFQNLTTVGHFGLNQCFVNCTSLTAGADISSVTSLNTRGLDRMYLGCSSLSSAVTPTLSSWNTSNSTMWLDGVAATGTLYNNCSVTIPTGTNGIPSGWTEDTSNRFVFSNTVITNVGNNQAQLTSDVQVNYTGSWDDGYFEVYNELDKDRSIHFSPSDITNGVLTASNLITESNVATLVSPATVTIYNSGTAVWTGSVSFTVVQ